MRKIATCNRRAKEGRSNGTWCMLHHGTGTGSVVNDMFQQLDDLSMDEGDSDRTSSNANVEQEVERADCLYDSV